MIRGIYKIASIVNSYTNKIPPALLAVFVCVLVILGGCGTEQKSNIVSEETEQFADSAIAVSDNEAEFSKVISDEQGVVNIGGDMDEIPGLEVIVDDFHEYYPNIAVNYINLTAETSENAGEPENADEVNGAADTGFIQKEYSDAYYIHELEPALDSGELDVFISDKILFQDSELISACTNNLNDTDTDISAVNTAISDLAEIDGFRFGVPVCANVSGLLVNKSILEQYDLDIPTEYIEFIMDCEVLKSEGVSAVAGDEYVLENLGRDLLSGILTENGDEHEIASMLNAAEEYAGDYLEENFEVIKYLKKKGFIDMRLIGSMNEADEVAESFANGEFAFWPTDYVNASRISKDSTDYVFIPVPLGSDGADVCAGSRWLSLNAKAQNPDAAQIFLNFICQREELDKIADAGGFVSVTADLPADCFDIDTSHVVLREDLGISGRVMCIYDEMLTEIAEGHLTVSAAIKEFDLRNKKSFRQYKRILKGKNIKDDKTVSDDVASEDAVKEDTVTEDTEITEDEAEKSNSESDTALTEDKAEDKDNKEDKEEKEDNKEKSDYESGNIPE